MFSSSIGGPPLVGKWKRWRSGLPDNIATTLDLLAPIEWSNKALSCTYNQTDEMPESIDLPQSGIGAAVQTLKKGSRIPLLKTIGKPPPSDNPIASVGDGLLVQTRLLSKTITGIFDDQLRPYGTSSAQFALLALIAKTEPITRARIARLQHLDKSTLTRNLRAILSEGWAVEVRENANGRSRPIALSSTGKALLLNAQSAWLAAQEQAKALLGDDATIAIVSCADRIIQQFLVA